MLCCNLTKTSKCDEVEMELQDLLLRGQTRGNTKADLSFQKGTVPNALENRP